MEKVIDKNKCTGCSACINICPNHAIEMIEDECGFKYPRINKSKCINCGLCKKTCPVLNTKENKSLNECYVGYNKNVEVKETSSSGGIFDAIARIILEENGVVIGAAFTENMKLKHIAIDNLDDLEKLKGSKYLQSNLENIFLYIKDQLKIRKVLFVGTPCQVAGLHAYLKKEYANLVLIDLFCHGVPSPKMFNKYLKELEDSNNSKVIKYNFRDKRTGWDAYSTTAKFANNKIISQLQKNNDYMRLFLSDIGLRESCYSCNFKLGNKYSDITLGDFWGVKDCYPEMYNEKGVSAIIINTEKGSKLFSLINNKLEYKKCNLNEIILGNPSLIKSSIMPKKRNIFFVELNDNTAFNKLVKKYCKKNRLYNKVINKIKRIVKRVFKNKKNIYTRD